MEKEEQMKEKKCKERNNYFKNRKQKKKGKEFKKRPKGDGQISFQILQTLRG